jgi:CDP-glucose 4,6-dehydratase
MQPQIFNYLKNDDKLVLERELDKVAKNGKLQAYKHSGFWHPMDTLFAYLLVAQKQYENPALSDAYNIGPGEDGCVSNKELADFFCKAWGNDARWECAYVDNPHESRLLKLDCSKIKRVLNQAPRWDIKQAVNETVAWYKAYFCNENISAVMLHQIEEFSHSTLS